jgi:hypothetical protein
LMDCCLISLSSINRICTCFAATLHSYK